jgi:DNA-3-methyladenine glycosylase
VAHDLLGRYLVHELPGAAPCVGRMVEVEAYLGEHDRASHASRGHTKRTDPMYGEAGHAYIYLIYGMYWCLNAVTEEVGTPCAVLIRGVEPVTGIEGRTDGPGRLTRAMAIDGSLNRADLTAGTLRMAEGAPVQANAIERSPRIGVAYAGEWAAEPLRFFVRGNPHVSRIPGVKRTRGGERP